MKTYPVAKTQIEAEKMASEFFKEAFEHSGSVGIEKKLSGHCACGETLLIEFYSKDDPGMEDAYIVLVCETCGDE